ncbi:MAG: diaminopimelate epimerase [Candidatus Omnitrophica bacterium]|jgi:diaminopimelate epimerase|nr:diaminopimelate epimerase [Candidatus Omnitrophota bacterium]
MKKIIDFYKMVAAGNDFVVVGEHLQAGSRELAELARNMCDRKYGIGADGILLIEKSKKADAKMRIFNADGSEAEMCGNGARCSALLTKEKTKSKKSKIIKIETKAGIIESEVNKENVKIKLTAPSGTKLNIPIKINNRTLKVNFVNTGVPHAVIFVEGLDKIEVDRLGRIIRYHPEFAPKGANVNFVEVLNDDFIKVRTYERGVEAETLACGTGSSASAIITGIRQKKTGDRRIEAQTKSGEILKVYIEQEKDRFKNVWLEGKAKLVYKGRYYV